MNVIVAVSGYIIPAVMLFIVVVLISVFHLRVLEKREEKLG
mgnify:CR=1 FL=1